MIIGVAASMLQPETFPMLPDSIINRVGLALAYGEANHWRVVALPGGERSFI